MNRIFVFALVPLAIATTPLARAADYGAAGTLTTKTSQLPANDGGATGGYVVVPDGAGPFPLVIASHGWSASADQQVGWGQQFASWGMVVVAPSFPNPLTPNDQTDAQIIETLAKLYADPAHASPAQGKVDGAHVGLEGHSAGGLATTLAAAAIHPQAVVVFDPVDSNGDGQAALPGICSPLLGVFANPSSCNNQEGWWPYANTTAGAEVLFHVVGSTHCDGENAARALCGSFCGGVADPTRQTVYARYATAFLLANLAGDIAAASTLTLSALSGDGAITGAVVKGGSPCDAPLDGGAGAADASSPVLDASTDAGGSKEAGPPGQDATAPPPSADAAPGGSGTTNDGSDTGANGASPSPGSGEAGAAGCGCFLASGAGRSAPGGAGAAFVLVIVSLRRRTRAGRALQRPWDARRRIA